MISERKDFMPKHPPIRKIYANIPKSIDHCAYDIQTPSFAKPQIGLARLWYRQLRLSATQFLRYAGERSGCRLASWRLLLETGLTVSFHGQKRNAEVTVGEGYAERQVISRFSLYSMRIFMKTLNNASGHTSVGSRIRLCACR